MLKRNFRIDIKSVVRVTVEGLLCVCRARMGSADRAGTARCIKAIPGSLSASTADMCIILYLCGLYILI